MGSLRNMADGLVNIMSGRGTSVDRGQHNFWHHIPMQAQQLEAAYRSSWLISKIVDLPAMDMVREWREWEAEADEIKKIETEEQRLGLVDAILWGIRYGRLGGGAVLLGTNANNLAEPVRPSEKLIYAKAIPRQRLTPGDIEWNPLSLNFGNPKWFELTAQGGSDRIDASRLLIFKGEPVPDLTGTNSVDAWWGDSVIERVDRAVKDAQTVTEGFAGLIDEAKLDIYRIAGMADKLMQPDGDTFMQRRFEATALGKSNWRGIYLDKEDEWETRQLTWAGMPEMVRTYLAIVAGAADIPATRLLGKSPDGMNATGEGDERNYKGMIATRQNMSLRPQLAKLDALLLPSLGLKPDLFWKFSPLDTPSEKELAEVERMEAESVQIMANTGTVPMPALEKSVQARMIDTGRWPGLEDELAKLPDDFGEGDDDDLLTAEEIAAREGGDRTSAGEGGRRLEADPPRRAANDAKPRTLYVSRKVQNVADLKAWARKQGLPDLQDDLHVTIAYSTTPVDWIAMGDEGWNGDTKGNITIKPGGPRVVEPLGDRTAVLMFSASELTWRNRSMREAGASWDWSDYQPHISLTGEPVDLAEVEPYRGEIVLGPEIFEEIRSEAE